MTNDSLSQLTLIAPTYLALKLLSAKERTIAIERWNAAAAKSDSLGEGFSSRLLPATLTGSQRQIQNLTQQLKEDVQTHFHFDHNC
ncbi:hypothetical protein LC605_13670 [Nostoc sp. CHAB 5836]|uniref:hypothetical protein n=1 Tax=Nostoc sp. CHAB 5836 TaxID=2780404 RepID=UPI001E348F66|nr:hypothetical protein [Nostoc sp. CHAB 5836]MCC5616096.1 hypothetical protein [Nostoc sp. CHAB 5836]